MEGWVRSVVDKSIKMVFGTGQGNWQERLKLRVGDK